MQEDKKVFGKAPPYALAIVWAVTETKAHIC
jgi:hypothetical protein